MPTVLSRRDHRQPWPGQRMCFLLVAMPCLPVLGLAMILAKLLQR